MKKSSNRPAANSGNAPRVHITHGNGKTCIDSFNLLAGSRTANYSGAIPKTDLAREKYAARGIDPATVCGTCSGDCPGCFAKRMTRYTGTAINYAENTVAAMTDPAGTVAEIERQLYDNGKPGPVVFRIHDSGDFFSLEYFAAWVEMIRRHPETFFGAYTKEKAIVEAYGLKNLPKNLSLSCSPWPGHCDPIGDLPQFCYDDGTDPDLKSIPHCPAVNKCGKRTGVTCNKCLHCYRAKRGDKWAVYAH